MPSSTSNLVQSGVPLYLHLPNEEIWKEWYKLEQWAKETFPFVQQMTETFPYQAQLPTGLADQLRLRSDMVMFEGDGCLYDADDNQLLAAAAHR